MAEVENEEEVSSNDNEMVEVKVLMALAEENDNVSKEGAGNGEWKRILGVDQLTEDPSSSGAKRPTTDYDSTNESSVFSTPLPPLKKLDGAEPIS
ncbi:hypothetical protein Tco_0214155 [Tanacetum coccineum]